MGRGQSRRRQLAPFMDCAARVAAALMPREAKLNVGVGIGDQLAEMLEAMQRGGNKQFN